MWDTGKPDVSVTHGALWLIIHREGIALQITLRSHAALISLNYSRFNRTPVALSQPRRNSDLGDDR